MENHIGPPKERVVVNVKARTTEILTYLKQTRRWRNPAQLALSAVLFWMEDNNVTKSDLAQRMDITEEELDKLMVIDFKLSTIGKLMDITGLDLFSIMNTKKLEQLEES